MIFFRSLGCFPTEGELNDMIAEVEEDEPTGYVRYERFEPMMTRVLMDKSRYRPEPEDRFVLVCLCVSALFKGGTVQRTFKKSLIYICLIFMLLPI